MDSSDPLPSLGFIGTGVMGTSMAGHLLAAGYPLTIFTRTRARAEGLLARGAVWAETPAALAARCEVVFTIVGFPRDVEEVYLGEHGLLHHLRPGSVAVDMTTSSPDLAARLAEEGAKRGVSVLDAPVSGGDVGAREARLSIMVGGDPAAFARVRPLFERMGRIIVHHGPAGSGQHAKMCNQIAIAGSVLGACEALAYAQRAGLQGEAVLQSISTGAAGSWSLTNLGPRILQGQFGPGFYVKHFVKDMRLAAAAADSFHLSLPGLVTALRQYEELVAQGGENLGTHGLFQLYQKPPAPGPEGT